MSTKTERLVFEEKTAFGWDECGFPNQDLATALKSLTYLRELESKKRFPHELRLVRVTCEILSGG